MNARFASGAGVIARGFVLLRGRPALWPWLVIPWLIDLAVLIGGWTMGLASIQTYTASVIGGWLGSGWLFTILYYPLLAIFGLAFLILWGVVVMSVALVVATPFTTVLVERALRSQGVALPQFDSLSQWVFHAGKMLKTALIKALVFGAVGACLFVASFIPGVNLAAGYFSMCVFAADAFDYSFEAMGMGWSRRWQKTKAMGYEVGGLGLTLALTSIIPGLTVFAMPIAAVGASTLVAEMPRD